MEQAKVNSNPRIMLISNIENKDELEDKFERCYNVLQNLSSGLSENDIHDSLNNAVSKDKTHEDVCLGLLMTILTNPSDAMKGYRDLTLITRDGLAIILVHLNQIVLEKYLKLNDTAKSQLLWLLREMIRTSVSNIDNLCLSLLRHAAGGDISQRNLFLIDGLLDIFQENRPWLDKFPFLVASIIYTYLRLIEDHSALHLINLRQKEVTFVVTLIRERISDCLVIGRDLVRLLQNVARISEFEILWRQILLNPKSLNLNFTGVLQLLQTRTSRRFLQLRLTPDMERKLVFLTSQVRFGNHKRYQEWFQRQYLATPESQTLRCDLIRFIVGVIHPTNELLCSDIIPRWAVIGWLFTTCTLPIAASNAKLALFYDWLFYDTDKDNIMNIEPAVLVMHNSMRSHPAVTATLLDFLCRIIPNFCPDLEDKVKNGIFSSLRQILEKRVLPSLYPLFDSPKLDRELRTQIRENFKEFCFPPNSDAGKMEEFSSNIGPDLAFDNQGNSLIDNSHKEERTGPTFSDEEDDVQIRVNTNIEDNERIPSVPGKFTSYRTTDVSIETKASLSLNISLEPAKLKIIVENLYSEVDNETRCQIVEKIVQIIVEDEIDHEILPTLVSYLADTLTVNINSDIFSVDNLNEEALLDSISTPLFVMLRNQFQLCREEDNRKKLLGRIIADLQSIQPRIGYLFLYFLKIWSKAEEKREGEPRNILANIKASVYNDFCSFRNKKLDSCLLLDLKHCHEENKSMFCFLLPDIYMEFQNIAIGNIELLRVVVSTVDSLQLQDLVCQIMQGHLKMFHKESVLSLLTASLNWETFEQYFFWQLIIAHSFSIDFILPILPALHFNDHAEALTSILFLLRQEKPTQELLKILLTRQNVNGDIFVVTVFQYWYQVYKNKFVELLSSILCSRYPIVNFNKRKRCNTKPNQVSSLPTGEQVLRHLDQLRRHCMCSSELQLYQSEGMQKALQQAQSGSSDLLRKTFNDLFALAEVNEENEPSTLLLTSLAKKQVQISPVTSSSRHKKIFNSAKEKVNYKKISLKDRTTESSDESTEDEGIIKPKQGKKRKKINLVGSDSD